MEKYAEPKTLDARGQALFHLLYWKKNQGKMLKIKIKQEIK